MLIDITPSQLMALTNIVGDAVRRENTIHVDVINNVETTNSDLLLYLMDVGVNKNRHAWKRSDDYLGNADVWTVLDLIAMEFSSDPTSVQCFDRRLVARAIELARTRRGLL